nr:NAD(P)H-hydrate dehydratase [Methylocapsa palsarum]
MTSYDPLELLTTAEMSAADRLTIASGAPGSYLMAQAGAAVALEAEHMLGRALGRRTGRIAIFCGPGNNGGDGFAAAERLLARGCQVEVGLLGPLEKLTGDAALAAKAWRGPVSPIEALSLDGVELAIDALFGAGLARGLDGLARETVLRLNDWSAATGRPVLAVDVPSGLDGSSGQVQGVAVKAKTTVTFFRRKPGHLLLPGRVLCGETILAQIGISDEVLALIAPRAMANKPGLWSRVFPVPRVDGHKYTRGHALILSGGLARTGAARLAARGALRAGAGLVTVATPAEALAVHAGALTAIMTLVCDDPNDLSKILEDRRKNAVVAGPGLGGAAHAKALVRALLQSGGAMSPPRGIVLDADVLTSFSGDAFGLAQEIRASGANVVLTPHEGEFARLFGDIDPHREGSWGDLQPQVDAPDALLLALSSASKLERVRAASALTGAVVLLKGPDTVVAAPDGRASIADDLPPWLATAGSGDVLAGMIGGLLAQGTPAFEAASAGVWLHGAAARHFGPGLIAEDIPESLPAVFRTLYESFFAQQV